MATSRTIDYALLARPKSSTSGDERTEWRRSYRALRSRLRELGLPTSPRAALETGRLPDEIAAPLRSAFSAAGRSLDRATRDPASVPLRERMLPYNFEQVCRRPINDAGDECGHRDVIRVGTTFEAEDRERDRAHREDPIHTDRARRRAEREG